MHMTMQQSIYLICSFIGVSIQRVCDSLVLCASLQKEGTGAAQRPQPGAQEAAAGLHRPAAAHAHRHLQREQAAQQRDADHHFATTRTGALNREQLLHERTPPLRRPLARRTQHQPWAAWHLSHHLLQGLNIHSTHVIR